MDGGSRLSASSQSSTCLDGGSPRPTTDTSRSSRSGSDSTSGRVTPCCHSLACVGPAPATRLGSDFHRRRTAILAAIGPSSSALCLALAPFGARLRARQCSHDRARNSSSAHCSLTLAQLQHISSPAMARIASSSTSWIPIRSLCGACATCAHAHSSGSLDLKLLTTPQRLQSNTMWSRLCVEPGERGTRVSRATRKLQKRTDVVSQALWSKSQPQGEPTLFHSMCLITSSWLLQLF